MKCMKVCLMVALAIAFNLHTQASAQTTSGGIKVQSVNDAVRLSPAVQTRSATVGAPYTISHGWVGENQLDGTSLFFFGLNPDPATMAINDAIMDGEADVIGADLAMLFGNAADNPVVAHECLESLGPDPAGSGRFLLRLTVTVEATGTAMEFDSLTIDNQDPLDLDMDGETGKGPDGVYFTADDVLVTDGFFDTADGTLDAVFPLDPVGLLLAFDADGDGDAMNDAPTPIVGPGFILGLGAAGNPIAFDAAGGPVTVTSAIWELRDANGDIADVDGDAIPDGPFDITAFPNFTDAADGGWDGTTGVILGADGNFCSTNDSTVGNVRTNQLVVEYLADVVPPLFCFSAPMMGCEAPSALTRFRGVDVGTPSVGDLGSVDGTSANYNPGFVLNDLEAPVWLILDYTGTAGGSVDVTSNAGTPGLTMTVEYADAAGSFGAVNSQMLGTAAESFNSFTTESFPLAGVTTNRVRVGWRQTGFIINFPWEVRVDSVGLCQ